MKSFICFVFLFASVTNAQNVTAVSHPAFLWNRVNFHPPKIAAQGGFQCLFGTVTFIPAALVTWAVKRHVAYSASTAPEKSTAGVIGDASVGLAFATAAGTLFAGVTVFLWSQGIASFAEAAASHLYNPADLTPVKTP